MAFNGAGGSSGGIGRFLVGFVMFLVGSYLLLNAIQVNMNYGFYSLGGFRITTGSLLIPFLIGTGIVFYNAKNFIGWLLLAGSLLLLIVGVISNTQLSFRRMPLWELIMMLVLTAGGAGILLSSLRRQ
ncbi:MAG: hypothetical protein ACFB0B_20340 [Thermonemataceae bacterium]